MRRYRHLLLAPLLLWACAPSQEAPLPQPSSIIRFVDATQESGIDFVHTSGRSGRKYGVETIGSGAAFFDLDNDGWMDLYAVNGGDLPGYVSPTPPRNALYRNRGGRFTEEAARLGVDHPGYGMGATAGDYDNDGDTDLFVTNFGPNVLYRNGGPTATWRFSDVTAATVLAADTSWSTGCAFADYDNDGDLDLYVANYLDYRQEEDSLDGQGLLQRPRRHLAPTEYPARRDFLYRNDGDGAFVDVTEAAGLLSLCCRELGAVFLDYDNDGDADLFQGNDATPNALYRNNGDGTFAEVGLIAGVAYNEAGKPEGTMGVDAADLDGDGFQELVMTNFQWESNTLYRNESGELFRDASRQSGIGDSSIDRLAFGINFFDADNDGDPDLYVGNGHIDEDIQRFDPQSRYAQPDQLYRNDQGHFVDITAQAGPGFAIEAVARGSAVADYDNDGDLDLFILNTQDRAVLLRNDTAPQRHWLTLRLRGSLSNRDGFGARVEVHAGGRVQWAEARSASSYLSQSDPRLFFGLDTCTVVDRIEVHWPSGIRQSLHTVDPDRVIEIVEAAQAAAQSDTDRPDAVPLPPTATSAPAPADWDAFWHQAPLVLPAAVRAPGPQPERPVEVLRQAVAQNPQVAAAHLQLADGLRLERDWNAAIDHYRQALKLAPQLAAAHTGLGQILSAQGSFDLALDAFQRAIGLDPAAAQPHYFTGNILIRQRRFDAAIPHYQAALQRDPTYLQAYINLAGLYARQTDYGPAIATLEQGIQALPQNAELPFQLARIHFAQGRHEAARTQLEHVLAIDPTRIDARHLLAQVHLGLKDTAGAQRILEEALDRDTTHAEVRARLGILLLGEGQTAAAMTHLQRAVNADPDLTEAYYSLGQAYLRQGDEAQANILLTRFGALQDHHQDLLDSKTAIVLNPNDARAYYRLGLVYARLERYEAARQAYSAALHIDPGHLDARNNLGNLYLRRRRLQAAIETYRQVLQRDPTYVRAYNNLGNAYLLAGQPDEALTAFLRAAELAPAYSSPHRGLVLLYTQLGQPAKADSHRQVLQRLAAQTPAAP